MALESVFAKAPPKVGHANKDTQNGEIESSIDDGLEVDLEEGEIVDSGKEDDDSKTGRFAGGERKVVTKPRLKKRKKEAEEQRTKGEEEEWFSPSSSPRHRPSHHHHGQHNYPVGPFEDPFMRSPCDSPDHHGGSQPGEGPAGRRNSLDKRVPLKKKKKKMKPGGIGRRPPKRGEGGPHKGGRSICKFYLDSKCLKGADCPFSHDAPVPRKHDLCKFYLSGYCARGENCSFMHEDFPCKFFHTGAKCFADTHCRFSHAPLDDEKQLLLQRYLDGSRMDDYAPDELMRHHVSGGSPMQGPHEEDQRIAPPPAKRPSLLGSPPRHVKEAAESWRMQFLGPLGHMMSPPCMPPFVRPNSFYMDTLSRLMARPIIRGMEEEFPRMMGGTPNISSPPLHDQGEDESMDCATSKGAVLQPTTIIPSTTHHSQSSPLHEPNIPGLTLLSESLAEHRDLLSDPDNAGNSQDGSTKEQGKDISQLPSTETSTATTSLPTAETALLPPNLPRRQRELFLRIQQQQKEQREAEESAQKEAGEDGRWNDEEDGGEEENHRGESSDDDEDFDDDRPLTAVLKKLQQQQSSESKEDISPSQSSTTSSVATSTTSSLPAGTIDIARMLSTIRQQVPSQPQTDFWKQLFSSTVPHTVDTTPPEPASRDPRRAGTTKVEQRDPRLRHDRPKPQIVYIESKDGDVQYKLRTIFRASPDYSAVVQRSAVDVTVRNDPRLARHLAAKAPVAVEPVSVKSRDPRVARHVEQQSKTTVADPRQTDPQVNPPLLNAPSGLPTPHTAPTRIDPRLARRQQKAKEPENKETRENPSRDQKEKREKKGRMDYASPLSSYDERPRGYNAYQRRPRPSVNASVNVVNTNVSPTVDDAKTMMPPPAALPMNPLPTSVTADELLFDDKQETKSLKEVFKTKDPTASPFC